MRGNNTLTLNEATMMEAVQLLLEADGFTGKVTAIKASHDGGYSKLFTVDITAPEEPVQS